MEEKIDVRLVEIIYFDVVDCQLLFLVTQLLPLALRLGDILLGKLRDAVVFVPEQLELLVDSFLFLFPGIGQSHPFVIFDDAYVQGCIVGVGDDCGRLRTSNVLPLTVFSLCGCSPEGMMKQILRFCPAEPLIQTNRAFVRLNRKLCFS